MRGLTQQGIHLLATFQEELTKVSRNRLCQADTLFDEVSDEQRYFVYVESSAVAVASAPMENQRGAAPLRRSTLRSMHVIQQESVVTITAVAVTLTGLALMICLPVDLT